jgi:hypothetical protein
MLVDRGGTSIFHQPPATFHMEVNVKLTWETIGAV